MHASSPKAPSKKSRHKFGPKTDNQTIVKRKVGAEPRMKIYQSRNHNSYPQTPRYLQKLIENNENDEQYLKTVCLTNSLIKAVQNQKQILKNIKTISAQILKNQKIRKKIQSAIEEEEEDKKFYFPIKTSTSSGKHLPLYLFKIEQQKSAEESKANEDFDEYCLLNTTKPKIIKTEYCDSEPYLKPKIITREKRKKRKKSKRMDSKKTLSLRTSKSRSHLYKSGSLKKSRETLINFPLQIEKLNKKYKKQKRNK